MRLSGHRQHELKRQTNRSNTETTYTPTHPQAQPIHVWPKLFSVHCLPNPNLKRHLNVSIHIKLYRKFKKWCLCIHSKHTHAHTPPYSHTHFVTYACLFSLPKESIIVIGGDALFFLDHILHSLKTACLFW